MAGRAIDELKKKVDSLCGELISSKNETARLKRLLLAAENKVKKLSGKSETSGGILDLSRQIEKYKSERKVIKAKVEKMTSKLEKFYEE